MCYLCVLYVKTATAEIALGVLQERCLTGRIHGCNAISQVCVELWSAGLSNEKCQSDVQILLSKICRSTQTLTVRTHCVLDEMCLVQNSGGHDGVVKCTVGPISPDQDICILAEDGMLHCHSKS